MRESTEKPDGGGGCRTMNRQHFDSVTDIRAMKPKHSDAGAYSAGIAVYGEKRWLGASSLAEVKKIIDSGWPDGLRRVREAFSQLHVPMLPSVRRVKARADFGDEVDMQRVYAGNLDRAWGVTKRVADPRRKSIQTVTILVRLGANCTVTSEQLFWQGATALALVDALRKSGRAVKLVGYSHAHGVDINRNMESLIDIALLEPGQHADLEKLASVICLAGFFRTEIFKAQYNLPVRPNSGLGYSSHSTPKILKDEAQHAIDLGICYTKEEAQAKLNEVAKSI